MKISEEGNARKQMQFWSASAKDYFKELYKDVREYPSLLLRHQYILDMVDFPARKVLDIGCGPGEMVRDLMKKGFVVYGVDISEGMLKVAAENMGNGHRSTDFMLQCGNIEVLPFRDRSFEGVVCAGVIEYLEKDDFALSELNRVLEEGGTLIITVRNKACPFRILDTIMDWTKENLHQLPCFNALKRVAHKERTRYIRYRKHFPWELDSNLERHGFQKIDFRYFHFYPFFVPFDKLFPSAFIKLGLKMECLSNSPLGFLGSGYIVKARKVRDIQP